MINPSHKSGEQTTRDASRATWRRQTKDNGSTSLADGETTVYAIVVENLGPNAVAGALLGDVLPASLVNAIWACMPAGSTATCPTPSSGTGSVVSSITLGAGQLLRFEVMAEVDAPSGAFVENTAQVALPASLTTLNASDDSATDRDLVTSLILFRDGFE